MALSERLAILITANPESAVKGFEKVGKAAEKNLGKAESSSKKFGLQLTKVGAGMAAVGGVALVGLGKLAEESEKSTLANLKLENSLKNSPNIANKSTKAYEDLADAIQSHTSVANEDVVSGEAVLVQLGLTAAQVKQVTPLVTDLAVKFGKDMPTAAKAVGKAINGSSGALGKMGIVLDKTALKADGFGTVTDALSNSVGGFANEQGKTFTGQLQRMKNELQDLEEGVGKGAVTAFGHLFSVVDKGSSALAGLSDSTQSTVGEFATYGSVALVAVGATSALIGMLIQAKANFGRAAAAAKAFATSESAANAATLGIVAALGAVAVAADKISIDRQASKFEEFSGSVDDAVLSLREVGKNQGGGFSFSGLAKDFDTLDSSMTRFKANPIVRNLWWSKAAGQVKAAKHDIDTFDKALASMVEAGDKAGAAAGFKNLSKELQAEGVSAGDIKKRFDDYAAALTHAKVAAGDAAGATDKLAKSNDGSAAAADAAGRKFQSLNDEIDKYLGKVLSADEAVGNFQKSINDEGQAVQDAAGHFNDATDKSIEFNSAQRDIVSNAAGVLQAMRDQGDSAAVVRQRQADLAAQYFATARANGVPLAVATKYRDAILGIPTSRKTVLQVYLDDAAAIAKLTALGNRINSLGGGRSGGFDVAAFVHANARAVGGPVRKGQPYIVGEKRPELFVPSQNGTIVPKVSGSSSSTTVNNYFTITESKSPQATAAAVQRTFRHERAMAGAVSIGE